MKIISFVLSIVCLFPLSGWSAQISLKSGEIIDAKKLDLPKEIKVTTEGGETRTIEVKDIEVIEIEKQKSFKPQINPPKKDPLTEKEIEEALKEFEQLKPYETPKQTFLTWRQAASEGSVSEMADCYVSFKQEDVKKELKSISRKDRKEMREAMTLMSFETGEPLYQGNKAFLEVTWTKGLHSESQVLKFLLEEKDWKIIE